MNFENILELIRERHKVKRAEFRVHFLGIVPNIVMICVQLAGALQKALTLREDPQAIDHYLDAAVLAGMAVQELEAMQKPKVAVLPPGMLN